MANNFSASFMEVWAKAQQTIFYKRNVARNIADMSFQSELRSGDILHRPYRSTNLPQIYTRGTDINLDDKTDTDQTLTVEEQWATGFYVDDFDQIQDNYDIAADYGRDDGEFLSNVIDTMVLGETLNAASTVDNGDLGGTAGDPISVDTSNISAIFGAARKKIQRQNVPFQEAKAVISPDVENFMIQYAAGRDTASGDDVQGAGYIGRFFGFETYVSNQLPCTAVYTLTANPSNGQTVVIDGITFTFVSSIGTTAGNVLIGVDEDATRANLAGLINNPTTTSATQVGFGANSTEARKLRLYASAVNNNTANTLTLTYKGNGVISVSAQAGTWGEVKQSCLFLAGRAPVCVIQREPRVSVKDHPFRHGKNILNGCLFGKQTFNDNAKRMVNAVIDASGF